MKKWFFIVVLAAFCLPAAARHVAGGELFYQYLGPAGAGKSNYQVTLRLFRECSSTGPLLQSEVVLVGIYSNNKLVNILNLPLVSNVSTLSLNTAAFPCLVGNVAVCYQMALYSAQVTLDDTPDGYTLARSGQYRIDNISNLAQKANVGSTYITKIPGTVALPNGHNSSPQFNVRDTALVCANKNFKLDFGAVDPDHDSLTYSFCDAYLSLISNTVPPSQTLDLIPLPYQGPYSGAFPLGPNVYINPETGIISGKAPPVADGQGYVVNVCITEWRNGRPFSEHRKDFILKVQDCDIVEADLPDKIIQCRDSTVHFENGSTSSAITSYEWQIGNFTTSSPSFNYTFPDTGRYIAKLTVTGPKSCVGSDSAEVLVYPGFKPAFNITASCFLNPYQFNDATVSRYGTVNSWHWNFGVDTSILDTSLLQNPTYKYPAPGSHPITLIVGDSKGCIDSLQKPLYVSDRPDLHLPFKDTLICDIDTLAIPITAASGIYSWAPNKNILFANTSRPLVFPKDTTRYIVTVNDNGCTNSDTVTVNVLPFIKVDFEHDSLVCAADTIRLRPVSQALQYKWTASTGETVSNAKYPLVQPLVSTRYYVTANLGKCQDRDSVMIRVVPYPVAQAGPDTVICTGSRIRLRSVVVGSSFSWTPTSSLLNANTPQPIAGPSRSTTYVLRVTDTLGCPKPSVDSIVVSVAPVVHAYAGRDTVAVPGEPLQLLATGGVTYSWTPETGLNDAGIANPVATLNEETDSIRYIVRAYDRNGCFGDDDVIVRVYRSSPDILVPSAFTPNSDGKNDVLKPIVIGITQLKYFRIYNRWGQLLYTTTDAGRGWDGTYQGVKQPAGAYVFTAEGVDYRNKPVFKKGTAVLIR